MADAAGNGTRPCTPGQPAITRLGACPTRMMSPEPSTVSLAWTARGRLLDVGCGPGPLTLLLAPLFGSATGVDGSAEMIATARGRAALAGVTNANWIVRRAEDIGQDLGTFRAVTFAQSFHWLNRPRVASLVRELLKPAGACVIVYATTHKGLDGYDPLPRPRPPWAGIDDLVGAYLGSTRRAGRGTRPVAFNPGDDTGLSDDDILAAAGFSGPAGLADRDQRGGRAARGRGRRLGLLAVLRGAQAFRSAAGRVRAEGPSGPAEACRA